MTTTVAWLVLAAVAVGCIGLDLLISRRTPVLSARQALIAAAAWTLAGLCFAPVVLILTNRVEAGSYLTVFVLEKTLSLDNVAMFAAVLGAAALPAATSDRVLRGGLLGALVLRVAFIAAGLAIIDVFHALLLGFAVVLVVSGVRMVRHEEPGTTVKPPSRFRPAFLLQRPELAALLTIVVVDVAFAADSILAAFAVTTSAFAIVAANVFAVLGLRPLYLLLASAMDRFRHLRAGIGLLLVAIGAELVVEHFVAVPSWVTLVGVATCLIGSIVTSTVAERGVTLSRVLRLLVVNVSGFTLLLAGIAMLVLPGPGLLAIAGGLAILATEYKWAARPLAAIKRRIPKRTPKQPTP